MPVHLTPMEAIMWRVGQDPTLRMTLGALVFLDRPPEPAALRARLTLAVDRAPRLSQRPDEFGGFRGRPLWIDDDPMPGAHVRELSIAAPGSRRQVLDLVGLLETVPFDPQRSPWDVTVIDGLAGGGAALYVRAHHVLTDGVAGLRLLGLLLDEPGWPRTEPQTTPRTPPPAAARSDGDERPLGTFTITIDAPAAIRRLFRGIRAAREFDPVETTVGGLQRSLDVANSVSRQLVVTGGPLAARPAGRSLLSRFELITVDGARSAALTLGGSRNDLLVAAAAAGLGRYYEEVGSPTAQLRLATPAAQGPAADELGGNWFAPARVEVPTANGRPGSQFGVVAERLAQSRREPALRVASAVAATLGRLPPRVLVPALRAQAESVDFAATVVPGLRKERHLCGATIEALYPLGPRLGCPINITAFGNGDRLDIGLAIDEIAFPDSDRLVACLTDAFAAHVAAGDAKPTG